MTTSNQEMFRYWHDSVPIPAYAWRREGDDFILIDYNKAADEVTRGVVKSALGVRMSEFYADEPDIRADMQRCHREGVKFKQEVWYHFKVNNFHRYLILQYTPLPPDLIVVYAEDITERKMAEDALLKSTRWLTEAQDLAHLGYWTFDIEHNRYVWSDQMCAIFGLQPGEVEPGAEAFLALLTEQDRPRFIANLQSAVRRGVVEDIDLSVHTQQGEQRRIRALTRVSPLPDGSYIPDFGIVWDVTENYRNMLELQGARDAALQASAAKSQFLSRMSHELRTPLNAIIGFSEVIGFNSGKNLNENDLSNLGEIRKAGLHLLSLINDMLDISQVEAGRVVVSPQRIELAPVADHCVRLMAGQALHRNITIHNNVPHAGLEVLADPGRLKQIVINLLSNAVKYNRPAGRVTLDAARVDNRFLRLSVSDTGPGIAVQDRQRIFDPFERLNVGHEVEGAGIGLGICKMLVEQMQGRIGVDSEPGQGSRFFLDLPLPA